MNYFISVTSLLQKIISFDTVKSSLPFVSKEIVHYMRTKIIFRIPFDNILNIVLAILALWIIISVFLNDITIDSMIARFGMASACIVNLFSKHCPIQVIFIITLIIIGRALLKSVTDLMVHYKTFEFPKYKINL